MPQKEPLFSVKQTVNTRNGPTTKVVQVNSAERDRIMKQQNSIPPLGSIQEANTTLRRYVRTRRMVDLTPPQTGIRIEDLDNGPDVLPESIQKTTHKVKHVNTPKIKKIANSSAFKPIDVEELFRVYNGLKEDKFVSAINMCYPDENRLKSARHRIPDKQFETVDQQVINYFAMKCPLQKKVVVVPLAAKYIYSTPDEQGVYGISRMQITLGLEYCKEDVDMYKILSEQWIPQYVIRAQKKHLKARTSDEGSEKACCGNRIFQTLEKEVEDKTKFSLDMSSARLFFGFNGIKYKEDCVAYREFIEEVIDTTDGNKVVSTEKAVDNPSFWIAAFGTNNNVFNRGENIPRIRVLTGFESD